MSHPTTFAEALQFPRAKAMPAEGLNPPLPIAHRKLDGHMLQVSRDSYGMLRCMTRNGTDITKQVLRFGFARDFEKLPFNTVIYGELWTPGKAASYTKTALKNRDTDLRFTAFAAWSLKLPALTLIHRAESFCLDRSIAFAQWWFAYELPKQLPPDTEGYVWKMATFGEWYKDKPVRTIDLIITGTVDGKNKYVGLIGAYTLSSTCGKQICNVGTGLVKADRALDPDEILGKVVEVAYDRVDSRGSLRFPRFIRFRDDKSAKQCRLSQDPELKAFHK